MLALLRPSLRTLAAVLGALLLVLCLAEAADAQRRRRRRRRRPRPAPTVEPAETETPTEGETEASPEGQAETPAGTEDAPPAQSPAADEAAAVEPEAPTEAPAPAPAEALPELPDLSPIQQAYTTLMDDLVQARSRVAVLGQQLFETKVRVRIHDRTGNDVNLTSFTVRLDGAPVFRADSSGVGEDARQVFEGFAAPGPHVLIIEAEQRARADDGYRYTLNDSYRLEVLRGQLTVVTIVLDDDSDIAEDFEDDGEGEYEVRTRVRVATRELGAE